MERKNLFAVVMAGGSGTRFWPGSRKALPKQFLPIGARGGRRALLRQTVDRLRGLVALDRTLVVTGEAHAALVRKCVPKLPPENILAEPVGRNTAPCVAWAAFEIERRDPDSVQIVLPSDHVIDPPAKFRRALAAAADEAAGEDVLLTLGIRPTSPATGYGYIEAGELLRVRDGSTVHAVARFVEKPDRARAEEFVRSGNFYWNAGIFAWSTASIVAALARHAPELARGARDVARARSADAVRRLYPELPSVAIDVAVMEKASNVRVVPIAFAWSDVGSWAALAEVLAPDAQGNCAGGGVQVLAEDSSGCILWGRKGELTALVGVRDLVVVRAGKATLVCPKDRAQDVRRIVARLEQEGPSFL